MPTCSGLPRSRRSATITTVTGCARKQASQTCGLAELLAICMAAPAACNSDLRAELTSIASVEPSGDGDLVLFDPDELSPSVPPTSGSPQPTHSSPVSPPTPSSVNESPDSAPPSDQDAACNASTGTLERARQPVDIVLVVDNSEGMAEAVEAIERHINEHLADVLDELGVDYRVIVFSGYRDRNLAETGSFTGHRLCVSSPLGPSDCDTRSSSESPHHDRLYHFDQPVASWNGPCLIIDHLFSPPAQSEPNPASRPTRADDPVLQDGWSALLRTDSHKALVVFSDDEVSCRTHDSRFGDGFPSDFAREFATLLQQAAPELFGASTEDARFTWHSVVGLAEKATADAAYEPSEPLISEACDGANQPGLDHQALSILTSGFRYPVCGGEHYETVFSSVAERVAEASFASCAWAFPEPPDANLVNPKEVNLFFTHQSGDPTPELFGVADAGSCSDLLAWHYDNPISPASIRACPALCELLSTDPEGTIGVAFGCATQTSPPR